MKVEIKAILTGTMVIMKQNMVIAIIILNEVVK